GWAAASASGPVGPAPLGAHTPQLRERRTAGAGGAAACGPFAVGRLGAGVMDRDDKRRHLGAASTQQGRGGPAHEGGEAIMDLAVVSTDLGRLSHQVTELADAVAGLRQGQAEQQALAERVSELAEQVTGIGKAVKDLGEKDPPKPPPQPWDWESMSPEQEAEATLLLAGWVETVLAPWWPRAVGKTGLPPCWI